MDSNFQDGYKQSYTLRPIWKAEQEILDIFVKLCEKHSFRYYLSDGTALGAARHKGFIPWDDDLDVSMPREDYDQFVKIAAKELPEHLKFVNWENTPEFPLLFGNIQDARRTVVESIEKECGLFLSGGIYMDIFPIDGYPKSKAEKFFVKLFVIPLSCIVRFRCARFHQQTGKGKVGWIMGAMLNFLLPWVSGRDCMRECEKLLRRHAFETSSFTGRASLTLTLLNRPPMPRCYWGEGTPLYFEQSMYKVPSDYDAFLRFYYGDYMELPPEGKRCSTHKYSWRCPWWLGPTLDKLSS